MKQYNKYIITFLTEFLILFLGILVYKLVNYRFNNTQFAEYNLFRRSVSLFQPLIMCGLGVSIPKFISKYSTRNSILTIGFLILSVVMLIVGLIFLAFRNYFSFLLLGSQEHTNYILILVLMLLGAGFHSIVYGFLRGKFQYSSANLFQLMNIGLVPVISLLIYDDLEKALLLNSILWIGLSIFGYILLLNRFKPKFNKMVVKHDFYKLMYFGIPRIPGDFALLLLISLPSFLVLHFYHDFILSGYVAFSTTMLNLAGAAFGPIGLILLPETNKLIKSKEVNKLKTITKQLFLLTLIVMSLGLFIFYISPKFFLEILISDSNERLILSCKLMLLGGYGYILYLNLRSILDAFYFKPVNSFNLVKTLFLLLFFIFLIDFFHLSFEFVLIGFVLSMTYLGIMTYLQVSRALKTK